MLKKLILFTFLLSTFALIALAPMNTNAVSENTAKLQATVVVTVVVPAAATPDNSIPVTGGMPASSTLLVVGLLVVLGVAVVVGGAALMSRRD